tara:strand:+ start:599 stop:895 length:297 start_codon:yes stop_codon:yes gene_type:complete
MLIWIRHFYAGCYAHAAGFTLVVSCALQALRHFKGSTAPSHFTTFMPGAAYHQTLARRAESGHSLRPTRRAAVRRKRTVQTRPGSPDPAAIYAAMQHG